jgi:hypothetical protein
MPALTSRHQRGRWWLIGTTLVMAAVFMALFVAASGANLAGSSFESTDGNLIVNTTGNEDWTNAPNRTFQSDPIKSKTDDAFGQGTKEDDANATVVLGSIPPQKSDLSGFYTSHEKLASNGHTYLYLAWERSNVLGSANMDFELNHASTTFPASGPVTIIRTAGDLLFTFDFGGSGSPTLGLLTWVTTGSTSQCFSTNSLPCWGNRVDLGSNGLADGSVNSTTVTDSIRSPSVSLPAGTFGEMAVDLTLALPDAFGPNPTTCDSFGQAFLKSRSSASFPAEIKDFVRPATISVSNCGYVLVHKIAADTLADQGGATFTIAPGQTVSGTTNTSDTIPEVSGHTGYYCIDNLLLSGSYTVTETAAPAGYDIDPNSPWTGLSATAGSCSGVSYTTPPTATVSASDPAQNGAISITKTAKNATAGSAQPLAGAVFSVNGVEHTTDASGAACWDNLPQGTYTIHEVSAPAGYDEAADQDATVTGGGDCTSGAVSKSFVDTPLTDIVVTSTSQVAGATKSTIACRDADNNEVGTDVSTFTDPASDSASDLAPGTYTCTVVVDP